MTRPTKLISSTPKFESERWLLNHEIRLLPKLFLSSQGALLTRAVSLFIFIAVPCCVAANSAQAQPWRDTFDGGPADWTTYGDASALYWSEPGVPPDPRINADDLGQGFIWGFVAGPLWLGNKSCAYGQTLLWDFRTTAVDGSANDNYAPDVELEGNGLLIVADLPSPLTTLWVTRSIAIDTSGGWRHISLDGPYANENDIRTVLANVTALRIRGEYWGNGLDTGRISEFNLGAAAQMLQQPQGATTCPDGSANFSVNAAGAGPFTYQWQIEGSPLGSNSWTDLVDGPIPGGIGVANNSVTNLLILSHLQASAGVRFRCRVLGDCGLVTSDAATLATAKRGDMNCDCALNGLDISPFVLALLNSAGYAVAHPNCDIQHGDMNGDLAVDRLDISAFVNCSLAGTCP